MILLGVVPVIDLIMETMTTLGTSLLNGFAITPTVLRYVCMTADQEVAAKQTRMKAQRIELNFAAVATKMGRSCVLSLGLR